MTAGFASGAKRLDWVLAALEALPGRAGSMPGWWSRSLPRIAARARITGHLDPAGFDDHIAAADALVNLRFPSAGESSGSLARGFAAGVCCLVSDTAAYAELPREAVIHLPLTGGAAALAEALAGLLANPDRASGVGPPAAAMPWPRWRCRRLPPRYRR